MRKVLLCLSLLIAPCAMFGAPPAASSGWQSKVQEDMPRLGHRNWILVVDSAYPLQSSPGVETVETNADQLEVIKFVLGAIDKSVHVRPDLFMDAELPYVQEEDAPGTIGLPRRDRQAARWAKYRVGAARKTDCGR